MDTIIFRAAKRVDIEAIKTFFGENFDEHVMIRPDGALLEAIDAGCLFIAEAHERGRLCGWAGVSGVYTFQYDSKILKEAGGSLISTSYRGRGIHKVFHVLRSVTSFIVEYQLDHYFGAIIAPNPDSERNLVDFSFQPWQSPPSGLVADRAKYAGPNQQIKFYELPRTAIPSHADHVLRYHTDRYIQTKRHRTPIVIATAAVGRYMKATQRFASGHLP